MAEFKVDTIDHVFVHIIRWAFWDMLEVAKK